MSLARGIPDHDGVVLPPLGPSRDPEPQGAGPPADSSRGRRRAFERFWRWMIEAEMPTAAEILPRTEYEEFTNYYRALPVAGDEAAIRRFVRGCWRSEAGWAANWIAIRGAREPRGPLRVLDAGSGFGTYSMLFSSLGAGVTGADLRDSRLSAAERRARFHELYTGRHLRLRYERVDLTRPWSDDYHLVWLYNALSHIDPLDAFLAQARRHLRPGGVLVVGDINGAHPEHARRLARLRTEVHSTFEDKDGGLHGYAIERSFAPAELRDICARSGFRVLHHELYWGGHGVLPEPLYETLLRPVQLAWRLGATRARRQLLVATPA